MSRRSASSFLIVAIGLVSWLVTFPAAIAQHSSEGTVSVTVTDPSGSIIPGAHLELVDTSTSISRAADTQSSGTYTFVNLPLGTYRLTVSKEGFKKQVFASIVVQATKTTDIPATLAVGATTETVEVTATAAPLVESSSNAIGNVIDLKQIEDLPIQGRDLTRMSQLVPGYTGTLDDGGGTWNGLPSIAQGNNIDGVVGSAGRMKFGGAAEPAVEPRIENIQEMTVQTDQMDLNQGYGTSSMQINFITRRGSNAFHGRLFEDFQNAALNATNWQDDFLNAQQPGSVPKQHLILNEFGGSVGGPIIKNKLFFFGSLSLHRQPSQALSFAQVISPAAQTGVFTYIGNDNAQHTVNLFNLAASCGSCGSLPTAVSQVTGQELTNINSALKLGGVTPDSDPSFVDLRWHAPTPDNRYYPTVRVDYNPNDRMRFNVAWNYTHIDQPASGLQALPGSAFANTGAGNKFKNYTAAFGFDWTLSPTLVNEFRGGFLYNANFFGYNAKTPKPGDFIVAWNTIVPVNADNQGGNAFVTPVGSYYPLFNASDTMTWQRHSHTVNFGFSWWREQNHYYNGVEGFPTVNLGLSAQDPAVNAFTTSTLPNSSGTNAVSEAQAIYATLVGRINGAGGTYVYEQKTNSYCNDGTNPSCITSYNLDELQKSFGLFAQDSYRIKPTLTLNYGLRWDFTWPDRDLTNAYHSAGPAAIWGPSGIGNIFHPGVLNGTKNPTLTQNSAPANPWFIAPQPAIGIAWNPHGAGNTVIRAGFSLRRFTEPQQYFWNQASDYGQFYFQDFSFNPLATGGGTQPAGTFAPGTLSLDNNLSTVVGLGCSSTPLQYACNPPQYQVSAPESQFTFIGGPGANGVDPHIKQPYTESWNFGVQHQFGESRALEVRYVGNRTLRQWITFNQNEVNILENQFLGEFKNAQGNLAAYMAANPGCGTSPNPPCSFADNTGVPGLTPLPIMDAAFSSDTSQFTNGGFINLLQTGQAGGFASSLATTPLWYCDLVGSAAFGPCSSNAGINVAGAGYPINFFQVNPYANNNGLSQLVSKGYSNYNGLQFDFRQRAWHGLQFDANYTWSHTLGITTQNNWQGAVSSFTLRNMRLSYGPALFDIRHSVHISGTYDLPFGKGKQFLTNGALDRVVGGWTIGTIFTIQSGNPFPIAGGNGGSNATFNDYGDGGVVLNGVTVSQLQSSVGVYHIAGQPKVDFINPKYLANNGTGGGANPMFITPNMVPGTIARPIWLYGPKFVNTDLSVSKHIPITERVSFSLQAEALNAFNHPTFQVGSGSGCSYYCYAQGNWQFPWAQLPGFGIGGLSPSYQPRVLELRGNIEF